MLSLLAFSAIHTNIALATSNLWGSQIPTDYHSQPHEDQQSDHFSCGSNIENVINHRIDDDHLDLFEICHALEINSFFTDSTQLPTWFYSISLELSKKPSTLTHNIILRI